MLDDYFTRAEILRRHRAGFFGSHLDSYTSVAKEHGYPRQSVRAHCYLFRIFGDWLERQGLEFRDLDDTVITKFHRAKRHVPRVRSMGTMALRHLLAHLRALGVVPERPAPEVSSATALVLRYGDYLEQQRALAPDTVRRHAPVVHQFLLRCFGHGPLRLRTLREEEVTDHVLGTAHDVTRRTHQTQMAILRSFFRFLLEQGEIELDLAAAVPRVANWRLADVPRYLTRAQVERVLAACDRNTPMGRRDFAILLLLARLGLRACEVSRLELGDIHWRTGELVIRGKGDTAEKMPLLADVGEALAAYIKNDRPRCHTRRVFTRMRAPITALARKGTVTTVVRSAMSRAGLEVPARGAHVLRHSLATSMLRDGASMSEISVVLRHRSPATTEIYAKVDVASLQQLAQPWPVGGAQ
jgi:site-specific recombinase XerD